MSSIKSAQLSTNNMHFYSNAHFTHTITAIHFLTRMWANAQRDGRPVEHRWRPLFNAAKFG